MFTRRDTSPTPASYTRRIKNRSKRRFSDQQIRSLESMFEAESRPELQIKQQLANQVGLQARQVAIWFQNKRARSKSKQIEQDYNMLKINYDTLASRFESLKKENQSLLIQLQSLRNLVGKHQGSRSWWLNSPGKSSNEEYENQDTVLETGENANFPLETYNLEIGIPMRDDSSENVVPFREELDILNMPELAHGSLTSTENGCSFEPSSLLDNSSCGSQWWEF